MHLRPQRAHLIGIAGNGMRALADVLLGWGWTLSGSDLNVAAFSRYGGADILVGSKDPDKHDRQECLPHQGVRLFEGHAAGHLPTDTELVVYSDAVPADNPELRRAAELGIPTLSYFQMLGRLGVGRRTVAVAGTHGKSTTTAMLAHLLVAAGCDPTVVYGATPIGATSGGRAGQGRSVFDVGWVERSEPHQKFPEDGGARFARPTLQPCPNSRTDWPCHAGRNDLMLVEACEYRANFLHLRPHQAAILGIEPDHFDCYDLLEQLEDAFWRFAALLTDDGFLLMRHNCPSMRRATAGLRCRVESFGMSSDADWSAHLRDAGGTPSLRRFEIRRFGHRLCEVELPMPGRHNVLNALAAAALAYENGLSADQISAGLATFPGLHRRLERLGTWRGAAVIDDYAHHPTEVTAALAAVRDMFPRARVWCVFQPHQASRTARLLDELAASLQNADKVLVGEIFRAREGDPQPGEVTAADLARHAAELGVEVVPGHADVEIRRTLETQLAPGDVLVTLGAGDVGKLRGSDEDCT